MAEDKDKSSKGQWHGGKGSIQKPSDQDKFAENYDKIFRKDKTKLTKREEVLLDPLAASQRSDKKKKEKYKEEGPKYEGPWGKDLGLK
tara:strand:+ start:734 stop:997 length:264 start_codon:yes stop_codon:yes gene_type:complete